MVISVIYYLFINFTSLHNRTNASYKMRGDKGGNIQRQTNKQTRRDRKGNLRKKQIQ